MDIRQRCSCALVSKTWHKAAATSRIVLPNKSGRTQLRPWLEKNGSYLQVLQLHLSARGDLPTALPCTQLQDLHLHCVLPSAVDNWVLEDISADKGLKTVSFENLETGRPPQAVMAVLAALPKLQHLCWCSVKCCGEKDLPGVALLEGLTKLTGLELRDVTAGALEHLSAFTKLRHLSLDGMPSSWGINGFPGLQQLTALTRLYLGSPVRPEETIPLLVERLTAVQHLGLHRASCMDIWELRALSGLTSLTVEDTGHPVPPSPLQLPTLQRLELGVNHMGVKGYMSASYLSDCPRLQELSLTRLVLKGSLCLSGLTMLQLCHDHQDLVDKSDVECLVRCCSSLHMLQLNVGQDVALSTLACLPYLTQLHLGNFNDRQCGSLAKVAHLRQLRLQCASSLSALQLLPLTGLKQLTSLGFARDDHGYVGAQIEGGMPDRLPGCYRAIVNKAPYGSPSDVPKQLRMCMPIDPLLMFVLAIWVWAACGVVYRLLPPW